MDRPFGLLGINSGRLPSSPKTEKELRPKAEEQKKKAFLRDEDSPGVLFDTYFCLQLFKLWIWRANFDGK